MSDEGLDGPDYLPISMLNQLEYCPRRFWLMYVLSEMEVNAPVLEGLQQHERAHTGGVQRSWTDAQQDQAGVQQSWTDVVHRRLYVWSDELGIAGFADVVEERAGVLIPVEYKHGRMGRWLNDHVQLCAQALCLEERTGRPVAQGDIFYWASRRRVRVELTPELRARTRAAVVEARRLRGDSAPGGLRPGIPPPIDHAAKCRDCSLEGVCLPREVLLLAQERE